MTQNERQIGHAEIKRIGSDNEFYNNVFKKTEQIVTAVFYILSYVPYNETTKVHHSYLAEKAITLHEVSGTALQLYEHEASQGLFTLRQTLVMLGSTVSLVAGARLLPAGVSASLADEIDQVLRYLKNHYSDDNASLSTPETAARGTRKLATPRRLRPQIPKHDLSSDAVLVYSDITNRTTRITTVLEAKPNATIKDLTDVITDVSAKTIQRELNALIETGVVKRQGERRWSTYSLV